MARILNLVYWCVKCQREEVDPERWEDLNFRTCLKCGEQTARGVVYDIVQVGNKQGFTVLSGQNRKEKERLIKEFGWRKN
jgi:hypothetical protein